MNDVDIRNFKKISLDGVRLAMKQRTRIWAVASEEYYRICSLEWAKLSEIFKQVTPSLVLDIGSGLGGYHIYSRLSYPEMNLVFLDKNREDDMMIYGYRDNTEAYNNFDISSDLIKSATPEVKSSMIFYDADYFNLEEFCNSYTKKFDIIMSLYSYCFHYPFDTYCSLVKNTLSDDGLLLIDLRDAKDQKAQVLKHFEIIQIITSKRANSERLLLKKK
jgi:SAM-dependent methyltransferase